MKFQTLIFVMSALTAISSAHAKTEVTQMMLDERTVEAVTDTPNGKGPHPLLVIAPDETNSEEFAAALVKEATTAGFVTIRLKWSFGETKDAKPSADLLREAEELSVVLSELSSARMMKKYQIDTGKIALVSRAFGSRVAMMKESNGTAALVKAHLLVSPVCSDSSSLKKTYAPYFSAKIPRLLIASSADGCPMSAVFEASKDAGEGYNLYTVRGKLDAATSLIPVSRAWLDSLGWTRSPATKKPRAR